MKLIDLDKAIESMAKLEQEDNEAYGVSIPECFDSNRAIKVLNNIPTVQAVPIEEVIKIIEFEEKWLSQTRMSIRDIDMTFNAMKSKIKQIEGSDVG